MVTKATHQDAAIGEALDDHRAGGTALQHVTYRVQAQTAGRALFAVATDTAGLEDRRNLGILHGGVRRRVGQNPLLNRFQIRVRHLLAVNRRGHLAGGDFLPQQALIGLALHDYRTIVAAAQRAGGGAQIETQLGRTLAVASETVLGEHRQHVALKPGRGGLKHQWQQEQKEFHPMRSITGLAPVTVTSEGVSRRPPCGYWILVWSIPNCRSTVAIMFGTGTRFTTALYPNSSVSP